MDLQLFYFFNDLAGQALWSDRLIAFLAEYPGYLGILFFLIWLAGKNTLSAKEKGFWFFTAALSAVLARGVLTEVIRYFYHHARPAVLHPAILLIPEKISFSFPSGHTIFTVAFATVIFFFNSRWGILLALLGVVTGLARVAAGVHWLSDILGGTALGILVGIATYYSVLHFWQKMKRPAQPLL